MRLVAEAKRKRQTPVVSSVSKSIESLLEAPASVVVITGDEIRRRGYVDIEAVLHDLPGFDFSKRAGASYSNIYQRGYRSLETNRTLLLVDGVEDNDLASSTAWISRQFALSNIDRIEVVYGPASTMYGANAFAGVVNIITKDPKALIGGGPAAGRGRARDRRQLGRRARSTRPSPARAASGGFELVADRPPLQGRRLRSPRGLPPTGTTTRPSTTPIDYRASKSLNVTNAQAAQALLDKYSPEAVARYFDVQRDAQGQVVGLKLNAAGAEAARPLDKSAFAQTVGGQARGLRGAGRRLADLRQAAGLELRLRPAVLAHRGAEQPAARRQPTPPAGKNGFLWTPQHTFLYVKYSRRFMEDKLSFTSFTQYKRHDLDGSNSANVYLSNYQLGNLGAADLLAGKAPAWNATYNYRSNDQLRSELNLYYEHSEKLNAVGGVELRLSSIGAKNVTSSTERPGETGSIPGAIAGDNQLASRDLGAYLQASFRPWQPLKVVLGGRLDNDKIRDTGGYGTVVNPRVAVVYTWRDLVLQGHLREGLPGRPELPEVRDGRRRPRARQPDARPRAGEQLRAVRELAAAQRLRRAARRLPGEATRASWRRCRASRARRRSAAQTTNQFQNVGQPGDRGACRARPTGRRGLRGSRATTPTPTRTTPTATCGSGDIASHRVNLLGGCTFARKLDLELRLNWVMGRVTGKGTTVDRNPYTKIPTTRSSAAAVTYRRLLPGVDLQLSVENLFDTLYYDPSLRNPSGFPIAARIPQPPRPCTSTCGRADERSRPPAGAGPPGSDACWSRRGDGAGVPTTSHTRTTPHRVGSGARHSPSVARQGPALAKSSRFLRHPGRPWRPP